VTPAERFGLNLLRCRRRVRLSQEQAAIRAGLHRTEIGFLENGRRTPRIDTLMRLCAAVEAAPAELLDGIEWLPGQSHGGRFSIPDGR
jgi:transcriptional regulator with XRE-family HTH domain